MDHPRSQSEDYPDADLPDREAGSENRGEQAARIDWKQHLISLRQTAKSTLDRLVDFLQRWRPNSADPSTSPELNQHLAATLESMSARQDTLEAMLHSVGASSEPNGRYAAPPEWALELQAIIANRLTAFESSLQELRQPHVEGETIDVASPPQVTLNDTAIFSPSDFEPAPVQFQEMTNDWLESMLGPTLYIDPKLERAVTWLGRNVLDANADAMLLLGQLLVFRFSSPDRKPTILKDLGEAYYRCFPKTRDLPEAFEEALSVWLKRQCAEAGLMNSIELVHPGERFDSTRHSPIEKGGVEITGVLGWVVLREGGRVFSKASVQTR